MQRLLFFLIFPLMGASVLCGAQDPFLREPVREGIKAIYDLDYEQAQKIFDKLKSDYPESPVGHGMTALRAWHQLLFASRNLAIYEYGMPTPMDKVQGESKGSVSAQEKEFVDANKTLQDFCDRLLDKNPKDPLVLYFKGVSYENLATHALTLDRSISRSRSYAKDAGKLHEKALQLNPSLVDANTSTAVPEYAVGTFNWSFRWLAMLFGLSGDKKGAIAKLENVIGKGIYRATDAQVVLGLLEAWRGDPHRAISLFKDVHTAHPRNFMCDISLAVAYEEAGKDPKSAIRVYQELLKNISLKSPGIQPGEIYFRIGKSYINLRDSSLALEQFKKALQSNQTDQQTKPLAYYEMARIYDNRKDGGLAKDCYRQAVKHGESLPFIKKEMEEAKKKSR
jgi:tetratricopeptide (TPR) repeat protein